MNPGVNGYRLVLCADDPQRDSAGYVFCNSDEEARKAIVSILRSNPHFRLAMAYEGDRLALTLAQTEPSGA